ncbi:PREDICTED: putative gamma-glutamylcyclotransferase At3g02910 isoform X2 [Ipomoea nil]|nr:PREDICTED: putative gamma-glutamylcyclotransferase At3g02910 isoform X2 [Ipomoea nil]
MANLIRSGDVTFRGEYTTVDAYPLVCGPYGIPYLINLPGSGVRVKGELYAVTDSGIVPMDELEGVEAGHYERLPLIVAAGDGGGGGPEGTVAAEAYFAHRSFGEGLWKRCGGVGTGEFTTEMASEYQRKEERPPGFNFLKDLKLFISGVE